MAALPGRALVALAAACWASWICAADAAQSRESALVRGGATGGEPWELLPVLVDDSNDAVNLGKLSVTDGITIKEVKAMISATNPPIASFHDAYAAKVGDKYVDDDFVLSRDLPEVQLPIRFYYAPKIQRFLQQTTGRGGKAPMPSNVRQGPPPALQKYLKRTVVPPTAGGGQEGVKQLAEDGPVDVEVRVAEGPYMTSTILPLKNCAFRVKRSTTIGEVKRLIVLRNQNTDLEIRFVRHVTDRLKMAQLSEREERKEQQEFSLLGRLIPKNQPFLHLNHVLQKFDEYEAVVNGVAVEDTSALKSVADQVDSNGRLVIDFFVPFKIKVACGTGCDGAPTATIDLRGKPVGHWTVADVKAHLADTWHLQDVAGGLDFQLVRAGVPLEDAKTLRACGVLSGETLTLTRRQAEDGGQSHTQGVDAHDAPAEPFVMDEFLSMEDGGQSHTQGDDDNGAPAEPVGMDEFLSMEAKDLDEKDSSDEEDAMTENILPKSSFFLPPKGLPPMQAGQNVEGKAGDSKRTMSTDATLGSRNSVDSFRKRG